MQSNVTNIMTIRAYYFATNDKCCCRVKKFCVQRSYLKMMMTIFYIIVDVAKYNLTMKRPDRRVIQQFTLTYKKDAKFCCYLILHVLSNGSPVGCGDLGQGRYSAFFRDGIMRKPANQVRVNYIRFCKFSFCPFKLCKLLLNYDVRHVKCYYIIMQNV